MRLGPPKGKKTVTAQELAAIMDQPRRVRALSHLLGNIGDGLNPIIDLYRPYVDGLARLPRDGRFFPVANHTHRLSQSIGERLSGCGDMAVPLVRGIGPTLIPRPQRMYLAFGEPISTTNQHHEAGPQGRGNLAGNGPRHH